MNGQKPASRAPREKQERARLTRLQLVAAARNVFARDGFELARLEDIAASAGKTRGAFYAHFRDKEDVFFAIFEEDLARDERRIDRALSGLPSRGARLDALTAVLCALAKNRRRMLLSLEFKLYAVRRPHRQHRLAELHAAMCLRCAETHIEELLPELEGQDAAQKRTRAAQFGALIDGLALNRLFAPKSLDGAQFDRLMRAGVERALGDGTEPERAPAAPPAVRESHLRQ